MSADAPQQALSSMPPTSPQRLAVVNTVLAVLQAAAIAYFGWLITGRLDLAVKERQVSIAERNAGVQERQASVAALEKMNDLLKAINDPKTDEVARARAVAQLSMYGSDAIFPAFVMAVGRSEVSPSNAVWVLRVLAVQRRREVCDLLLGAQRVPELINEIRKQAVQELVHDLGCQQPGAVR